MSINKTVKEIVESKKEMFESIILNNLAWKDERVLIIGDTGKKNYELSRAINYGYKIACEELNINYDYFEQKYYVDRINADKELIKKMDSLPDESIIINNISGSMGKLGDIGKSFRRFARARNHKFVSASSLGSIHNDDLELFLNAMDIDYEDAELNALNLKKKLDGAKEIHIKTKAGTDLYYNIEGVEARINTGVYKKPGLGGNLPGVETYIPPNGKNVNGVVVIDVSSKLKKETQIISEPIRLIIQNGSVVKIEGGKEAEKLKRTIREAKKNSKRPENVIRIAELGIGLNKSATVLGAMIIDEKLFGTAHIALGSNYWFGGDIKVNIHLDQVFRDPIIEVDGKLLDY